MTFLQKENYFWNPEIGIFEQKILNFPIFMFFLSQSLHKCYKKSSSEMHQVESADPVNLFKAGRS